LILLPNQWPIWSDRWQNVAVMRAWSAAVANWQDATDEDRTRAVPLLFATFKLFENAWFQQRQGTLDPQH
jgi:hypothetical protein